MGRTWCGRSAVTRIWRGSVRRSSPTVPRRWGSRGGGLPAAVVHLVAPLETVTTVVDVSVLPGHRCSRVGHVNGAAAVVVAAELHHCGHGERVRITLTELQEL